MTAITAERQDARRTIPQGRTAVYWLYDAARTLLYVGVAVNFGRRWQQHALEQSWWPQVQHQAVTWYDTREEALDAEKAAIRDGRPLHNKKRPKDPLTGFPGKPHTVPRKPRARAPRPDRAALLEEHAKKMQAGRSKLERAVYANHLSRLQFTLTQAGAIAEMLKQDPLGAKWEVVEQDLATCLHGLNSFADHALRDAISRWWEQDQEPTAEGFAKVGLRVSD